jgi:dihydrofolate reductase
MRISIVVIVAENGAIGKDNALLLRLPEDLKHFKTITMGKPIVMGRKTYDSIGRPLPGRTNIVISRQADLVIPGCVVVNSLSAAINAVGAQHAAPLRQELPALLGHDMTEVMIVGGAEIYRQALPLADTVYLTKIHAALEGDVFFPVLPDAEWRETHREEHVADDRHAYPFTFVTLERKRA